MKEKEKYFTLHQSKNKRIGMAFTGIFPLLIHLPLIPLQFFLTADDQENMEATTVTASTTTTCTRKQERKIRSSKAPSCGSKALASSSYCTPKQVNAFHAELNEVGKKRKQRLMSGL